MVNHYHHGFWIGGKTIHTTTPQGLNCLFQKNVSSFVCESCLPLLPQPTVFPGKISTFWKMLLH